MFKDTFGFENYFDILEFRDIYTLCKFRTINHKLPIEIGRWTNIQRDRRNCKLRNSKDLGDEYHYIMMCTEMSVKRNKCID